MVIVVMHPQELGDGDMNELKDGLVKVATTANVTSLYLQSYAQRKV